MFTLSSQVPTPEFQLSPSHPSGLPGLLAFALEGPAAWALGRLHLHRPRGNYIRSHDDWVAAEVTSRRDQRRRMSCQGLSGMSNIGQRINARVAILLTVSSSCNLRFLRWTVGGFGCLRTGNRY